MPASAKARATGKAKIKRSDFIRKKWLDNDFYGAVSTLYGKFENLDLNFGIVGNQYYGRHFGNVSDVFRPQIFEHEYYRNNSLKNEIVTKAKAVSRIISYTVAEIEAFPGRTLPVFADEQSLAAYGPNPLDPACREPAARAGREQGRREAQRVAEFLSV